MAQTNWEADKMLDVYIYDYLVKRNLQASAKAFQAEGKVSSDPVAIDAPGGFLFEWWSVFWDIFIARTNEKHSEVAASYIETQQFKAREQQQQQQLQQQQQQQKHQQQQPLQLQMLRHPQQQPTRREGAHLTINGTANGMGPDNLSRQSTANAMATKIYEDRLKHPQERDTIEDSTMKRYGDSPTQLLDANQVALLKTTASLGQPSGPLLHNAPANISTALQQAQARNQLMPGGSQDNKNEVNTILNQRSPATDPSIFGVSGVGHSKPNLLSPGVNQGANALSIKGWPLTRLGLDQLRPGLMPTKSFNQSPQHYQQLQTLNPQQPQFLLQQAQGILPSSLLGDAESRKYKVLLNRSAIPGKDGQTNSGGDAIQGVGSPMQAASPHTRSSEELLTKVKISHFQQQPACQMQQQLPHQTQSCQQQQPATCQQPQQERLLGISGVVDGSLSSTFRSSDQNGRKRKQPASSSGPANSTGTGNTVGPNSAPSTPSIHTPGDAISMAGALQHGGSTSKPMMLYGADVTGPLASSSNQLADIDRFAEDGSLDDNVESFLSHEEADQRESFFSCSKRSPTGQSMDISKGFSFTELGCIQASNNKVVSCDFSSDGKLLATAGHDKKSALWNVDTLKLKSTLDEHSLRISDVRFSPNSTRLATSSHDKTVKVWDADNPSFSLRSFSGHVGTVMSLDFHPDQDLLCSCDGDNEIRYWSVNQGICTKMFKGGTSQVRFQPRVGKLLAAAADYTVSIFDVESEARVHSLQAHTKRVQSVCWDATGDYLASVSEDSVRVWALGHGADGECVHELSCNGAYYCSCTFHPKYPHLLIIGCYQSLVLWSMQENKSISEPAAHDNMIAALAQSPMTGLVASASHDKFVKLWK